MLRRKLSSSEETDGRRPSDCGRAGRSAEEAGHGPVAACFNPVNKTAYVANADDATPNPE